VVVTAVVIVVVVTVTGGAVLTVVISFTAGNISSVFSETDLKITKLTAAKSKIDVEIRVTLSRSFNIGTFTLIFLKTFCLSLF
jgi:hypothetical protein